MGFLDSIEQAAEAKVTQSVGISKIPGFGTKSAQNTGGETAIQATIEYEDKLLSIQSPKVTVATDSNGNTTLTVVGVATTKAKT